MGVFEFVLILIVAVVLIVILMFPEVRGKIKALLGGFLGVFVEDMAKTPEGAAATYQQAIDEQQEIYNQSQETLKELSGQLSIAKDNLKNCEDSLLKVEKECESLAKNKKQEELIIKAQQREDIIENVMIFKKTIEKLEPLVNDAQELLAVNEARLIQLKKDKKNKVTELKLNNTINDSYDKVNSLKKTTASAKLLGSVEEGVQESREKATGAKILYENKMETKIQRAEQVTKKLSTSSYVDDLMNKYNKK